MKKRHAIGYAFPTSPNAKELGFYHEGCYYVQEQVLREDGTWSPPYIAPGCEGFPSENNADLLSLLNEYLA